MDEKIEDMTSFKVRVLSLLRDFQNDVKYEIYVSEENRIRDNEIMDRLSKVMVEIEGKIEKPKSSDIGPCNHCGGKFLFEDMFYGADPFDSEINGDDTPMWLCSTCRHNSCMEI